MLYISYYLYPTSIKLYSIYIYLQGIRTFLLTVTGVLGFVYDLIYSYQYHWSIIETLNLVSVEDYDEFHIVQTTRYFFL